LPRDYKLYTDDILDAIAKIFKYTRDMDYTSFVNDDKTIDAVVRNLEIIGEAAKTCLMKSSKEFNTLNGKRSEDCGTYWLINISASIIK
jgi:uncharacterized protein with HEPN domain